MNKISIGWGFVGVGIFMIALIEHIKHKRTMHEVLESSYNITRYCFDSIEEMIGFINERCDDLTEEEKDNIEDLWETIQRARKHLPHGEHR